MKIKRVLISFRVADKIARKHGIIEDEVYEVFENEEYPLMIVHSQKVAGTYVGLGRTEAGRYLMVAFLRKRGGTAQVLTAREMDGSERRRYVRHVRR